MGESEIKSILNQTRSDKIDIRKRTETQTNELKQKQVYPSKDK